MKRLLFVIFITINIWVRGFCNGRSFKGFFVDSEILDNLERNYIEIDKEFKIFKKIFLLNINPLLMTILN